MDTTFVIWHFFATVRVISSGAFPYHSYTDYVTLLEYRYHGCLFRRLDINAKGRMNFLQCLCSKDMQTFPQ